MGCGMTQATESVLFFTSRVLSGGRVHMAVYGCVGVLYDCAGLFLVVCGCAGRHMAVYGCVWMCSAAGLCMAVKAVQSSQSHGVSAFGAFGWQPLVAIRIFQGQKRLRAVDKRTRRVPQSLVW